MNEEEEMEYGREMDFTIDHPSYDELYDSFDSHHERYTEADCEEEFVIHRSGGMADWKELEGALEEADIDADEIAEELEQGPARPMGPNTPGDDEDDDPDPISIPT